jgi:hypothetical protein
MLSAVFPAILPAHPPAILSLRTSEVMTLNSSDEFLHKIAIRIKTENEIIKQVLVIAIKNDLLQYEQLLSLPEECLICNSLKSREQQINSFQK